MRVHLRNHEIKNALNDSEAQSSWIGGLSIVLIIALSLGISCHAIAEEQSLCEIPAALLGAAVVGIFFHFKHHLLFHTGALCVLLINQASVLHIQLEGANFLTCALFGFGAGYCCLYSFFAAFQSLPYSGKTAVRVSGSLLLQAVVTALLFAVLSGLDKLQPAPVNSILSLLFTAMLFLHTFNAMHSNKAAEGQTLQPMVPQGEAPSTRDFQTLVKLTAERYALTAREIDILIGAYHEKTNAQMAAELAISENTVKYHMKNLLKKLSVNSRKEIMGVVDEA